MDARHERVQFQVAVKGKKRYAAPAFAEAAQGVMEAKRLKAASEAGPGAAAAAAAAADGDGPLADDLPAERGSVLPADDLALPPTEEGGLPLGGAAGADRLALRARELDEAAASAERAMLASVEAAPGEPARACVEECAGLEADQDPGVRAAQRQLEEARERLASARARLRQLELAGDSCLQVESAAVAAMEEMEQVAKQVARACSGVVEWVAAAITVGEACQVGKQTGLAPSEASDCFADASGQLTAARRLLSSLSAYRSATCTECIEAESAVEVATTRRECERRRYREEAAHREVARQEALRRNAAAKQAEVLASEAAARDAAAAARRAEISEAAVLEACTAVGDAETKAQAAEEPAGGAAAEEAKEPQQATLQPAKEQPTAVEKPSEGEEEEGLTCELADPRPFLAARAAQRLYVSSAEAPIVAGEYRLVESPGGRPAWKASGPQVSYLLWTPREGGCWAFCSELDPQAEKTLVRSLQFAWTCLPDELMCTSWTKAPWRGAEQQKGGGGAAPPPRAKVFILRG